MVRMRPSLSITMALPSRSRPSVSMVRPSGLMVVLRWTTAERIWSSEGDCARDGDGDSAASANRQSRAARNMIAPGRALRIDPLSVCQVGQVYMVCGACTPAPREGLLRGDALHRGRPLGRGLAQQVLGGDLQGPAEAFG